MNQRWSVLTSQSFRNGHWFKSFFLFLLRTVLQVLILVFFKAESLSQEKVEYLLTQDLLKIPKWQVKWRGFDWHATLSDKESENKQKWGFWYFCNQWFGHSFGKEVQNRAHIVLFVQKELLPSLISLYWQTLNFSTGKHCNILSPQRKKAKLKVLYLKLVPGPVGMGPSHSAGLLARGWELPWFYALRRDLDLDVSESLWESCKHSW